MGAPKLDPGRDELKELMKNVPADLRPLIPGFLERRKREADELRDMIGRGDFSGIRNVGHKLKGNGAGYGFPPLSAIGRDLETAARDENGREVENAIARLLQLTDGLRSLLPK